MNRQNVANFLKSFFFSKAKSIGEYNTPAPIGKADQICRMNCQPIVILWIFLWIHLALPIQKVNYMRQYIGGVTADRNILSPLCLIAKTSPLNRFLHKNYTFKLQITLDCHSPRLMLNNCLLPDPPHCLLLSTFK
jgi:hypothetical protein